MSPNHFFLEEHMLSEFMPCRVFFLVILCEPVKAETESRNFSALVVQSGPLSAFGNVSGNRGESDCSEFDPGSVSYFLGDRS